MKKVLHIIVAMVAMLFCWEDLIRKLEKFVFDINPNDACITHTEINSNQCTVVLHMGNLKISHKGSQIISKVIAYLKSQFDKNGDIMVIRGK